MNTNEFMNGGNSFANIGDAGGRIVISNSVLNSNGGGITLTGGSTTGGSGGGDSSGTSGGSDSDGNDDNNDNGNNNNSSDNSSQSTRDTAVQAADTDNSSTEQEDFGASEIERSLAELNLRFVPRLKKLLNIISGME